jgi:hypothetical protein
MSEPVNLDALREAIRGAKGIAKQPPIEPPIEPRAESPIVSGGAKKKSGKRLRTYGFGLLSLDEQQRFQSELRAQNIAFKIAGKGAAQEIILLEADVNEVFPGGIENLLAAFGIAIG